MVLAIYVFQDNDSASKARDKICENFGGSMAAWTTYNEVSISSDCRDSQKASEICRAYGGKPR